MNSPIASLTRSKSQSEQELYRRNEDIKTHTKDREHYLEMAKSKEFDIQISKQHITRLVKEILDFNIAIQQLTSK